MEKIPTWNEFQKLNKGKTVTTDDWHEHRRSIIRRRPLPSARTDSTVREQRSEQTTPLDDTSAANISSSSGNVLNVESRSEFGDHLSDNTASDADDGCSIDGENISNDPIELASSDDDEALVLASHGPLSRSDLESDGAGSSSMTSVRSQTVDA